MASVQATATAPAAPARAPRVRAPFDLAVPLMRVWGVLVFLFLFLPIAYVVVFSFNTGRLFVSWEGAGLDAYESALTNPALTSALSVSLRVGVVSAVVATVFGTLSGMALARSTARWTVVFSGLLGLTLVTPEIVDAISLLPWYVTLGTEWGMPVFNDGFVRLVIGHSLFSTAVVTFIVRARLSGIDQSLEEAAADLYAPAGRRFRQITLPLMAPAILAGAMMAFTLSLDNTIISSFITVSGTTSLPVYIFGSVRSGLRPEVASISTVMLLLTLAAMALVVVVLRRSGQSSTDIASTMAGM